MWWLLGTIHTILKLIVISLFAALVVALSATHYLSEYLERRDFFMNVQLDKQRNKIEEEKEKADQLLLNILPKSVINNLKHKRAEPEYFSEVTVLFADIVGFTDFCSHKTPAEVVLVLSGLFLKFDELVHRHNVEKIKTVGDAYIVAAGVPIPCKDHAEQVVSYAIDMLTAVKAYNIANHRDLKIRIGIHTGPCVAGLLGIKSTFSSFFQAKCCSAWETQHLAWKKLENVADHEQDSHTILLEKPLQSLLMQKVMDLPIAFTSRKSARKSYHVIASFLKKDLR